MSFNWFDHIFVILIGVIIPVMSVMSGKVSKENAESLPPKKHLYYSNGLVLIIGSLLVLTSWNISDRPWDILGIAWPVVNAQVIMLTGAVLILYILDVVITFFKKSYLQHKIDSLSNVIPMNWNEYKHYIFMAVSAGICEEIVFRGFLIQYLAFEFRNFEYVTLISIGLPAVIFSLSHYYQGLWAVLKIFFLAIFFALIFLSSESLLIVIIVHVMIDLISGLAGIITFRWRTEMNKVNKDSLSDDSIT